MAAVGAEVVGDVATGTDAVAEAAGAVAGAAATGAEAAAAVAGAKAAAAVAGAAAAGVEAADVETEGVDAVAKTVGATAAFPADVVDAVGFVEVWDVVELAGLVLVGVGLATTAPAGVDDVESWGAVDVAGVDVAVLEEDVDVEAGVEVAVEGEADGAGDEVELELVVDWVVDPETPDAAFKIDCNGRATTYGFPSTAVAGAEKEMVEPDVELAQALPPIANVMTATVATHVTPRIALRTNECTQPSLRVRWKWGET